MNFCIKCGNKLEESWTICPNCGNKLDELKEIKKPKQEEIISEQEIVIPQQPVFTNKRIDKISEEKKYFIKNKKVFALSISLVVICILAGVLGMLFIQSINRYNDLSEDYSELWWYHDNLVDDYEDLEQKYDDLLDDYNELFTDYNFLFGEYYSILSVLEDPLTNPVIPTISQVQDWLAIDDTDDMLYTENWMCGDFSAMLMVRAKAMNWRIRIACMFYSFIEETEYGTTDPYGHHGHAFNLIICQDGSDPDNELDLYYIEPQSDGMWWLNYGDNNHFLHYEIWAAWTGGISGTVWNRQYWVNHYSYFA